MLHACMLVLTSLALLQDAPKNAQEQGRERLEPPTYNHGKLRCKPIAIFDARYWYLEDQPGARPSELQMRWRVAGERITEIARHGDIIFTEAVTDKGQVLIDPNSYTEEQRNATRPPNAPGSRLSFTGLLLPARLDSPNRDATSLKLRGSVRLIFAQDPEELTIDNPRQYSGKTIANDRLSELGIEIRVVPREELESSAAAQSPGKFIAFQVLKGEDHIQNIAFYNGWMKEVRYRRREVKLTNGETAIGCAFGADWLTDQCQLVLEVFPKIEEEVLPIEVDDLKLP